MKKFQKVMVMVLALLLFTSCTKREDWPLPAGAEKPPENDAAAAPRELTICVESLKNLSLGTAIEDFQALHPDIAVTVVELVYPYEEENGGEKAEKDMAQMEKRASQIAQIRAEILSGKGPDLFLLDFSFISDENLFPDIGKIMDSGVLANVTPLLEERGYTAADFYETIVNGCRVNGAQYLFPLSFSFPCTVATGQSLAKFEVNTQRLTKDIFAYMEEAARTMPEEYTWAMAIDPLSVLQQPVVDYTRRTVDLDNAAFQSLVELAKENERRLSLASHESLPVYSGEIIQYGKALAEGEMPFYTDSFVSTLLQMGELALGAGKEPQFYPVKNEQGKSFATVGSYGAIRAGSKNQAAATELLLYLLSNTCQQAAAYPSWWCLPIRRESLPGFLEHTYQERTDIDGSLQEISRPLSAAEAEALSGICEKIESVKLQDFFNQHIILNGEPIVTPLAQYYYDEITYEEMIEYLRTNLQFYMDE